MLFDPSRISAYNTNNVGKELFFYYCGQVNLCTMKNFRGELTRFSQVKILYLITCYRASVLSYSSWILRSDRIIKKESLLRLLFLKPFSDPTCTYLF